MTVSIKPFVAGVLLAAACAAQAADAPSSTPVAASPAVADDGPAAPPPSAQMAVRDVATGRLRAATSAEAAALHAAGPQALSALRGTGNRTRYHASGATGARLSDRSMSYAMVLRQPDGRIAEYCFDSREAAEAALSAPVAAPVHNALPTE